MLGQDGSVWFLAGVFGGGTATRTCEVPEDKLLFFPVINSINIDTPGVCGQGAESFTVAELREFSDNFIDDASVLLVELDGERVDVRRVQSPVFKVTLPEDNIFDPFCPEGVPAGTYFPAVDEGYYAAVGPLEVGTHTLRIYSETVGAGFVTDVTYYLTVVPVDPE